jgi:hypothetical protein
MVFAVPQKFTFSGRSSTSNAIVCDKSPCATAPMTRAVAGQVDQIIDQGVDTIDRAPPETPDIA